MLSNTAVPTYYGQFREAVFRGEIPVCRTISMEMNRIDALIEDPSIYYDDLAVEGYIEFCNNELTLTDGSDLRLVDSFKLWAEQLYGWYYFVERSVYDPQLDRYVLKTIKRRLINKQYLIVGRGAAKTMYGSGVQGFHLTVDKDTTSQLTTAPTMSLADEMLSPLRTAIARARGPLFKFLTEGSIQNTTGARANRQKLASTKKGIQNFLTESIFQPIPMSIDKLQGRRTKINTVDEWLSVDIRENPITAIEGGASKMDDYIILSMSSEGTTRNGPGDTIKIELMNILKGDYNDPHTSIWWYQLDDVAEVSDPKMWLKANPNIGKTVSWEAYQRDVDRMEGAPATRNEILAKRFGLPMAGHTYFFTYEETLPHRKKTFWKLPCALGMDLSQGDDFCAFTFLFPLRGGEFGVKTLCFITDLTLSKLPTAMRIKYDEFLAEGSLIIMDGKILNMLEVYEVLDKHIIDNEYDIRAVGFDPYNAKEIIDRWVTENGQNGVEKVIQGSKTETVPLGELKIFAKERMLLFDESLMVFGMGNCIVEEDTNGNRKLLKRRYDAKIDPVSAMMDAYIAYKHNKEEFE